MPAQRRAHARRDSRVQRAGYRVVRLPTKLVLGDLPAAIAIIQAAL